MNSDLQIPGDLAGNAQGHVPTVFPGSAGKRGKSQFCHGLTCGNDLQILLKGEKIR